MFCEHLRLYTFHCTLSTALPPGPGFQSSHSNPVDFRLSTTVNEERLPITEPTPDQEIDELWSPPPAVEDDRDDPDYISSEVDELEEGDGELLPLCWRSSLGMKYV